MNLGYLLKFNSGLMKDGIKRMINGLDDKDLGVFGSLRESNRNSQPDKGNPASARRRSRP